MSTSFRRPLRSLPVLAALFLLTLVSCQGPRWQVEDSDGTRWTRKGNEWSIRQVDPFDDSVLTAELKVEREESDGIAHYRLIEVDLFPPGDPMPRLWRLLPPRSQLRAPDGTVHVVDVDSPAAVAFDQVVSHVGVLHAP